jgi:hypothetical protein
MGVWRKSDIIAIAAKLLVLPSGRNGCGRCFALVGDDHAGPCGCDVSKKLD